MQTETQLAAICEIGGQAVDGYIIYNTQEREVYYQNAAASLILGSSEGVLKPDFDSVLSKVVAEDRDYVRTNILTLRTKPVCLNFEFRMDTGESGLIYICCNIYTILHKKYTVAVLQDISNSKRNESHIIEFGTKKNTLLDSLVHNLSGPLRLTQNLIAEVVRPSEEVDSERVIKYLSLVKDNTAFCIDMINNMLTHEYDQSASIDPKTTRFDVVEKIKYIVHVLSDTYRSKKFVFESDHSVCFANGDDVKMLQVVINFVSNAIKYTRENGIITIQVRRSPDEIIISINDNGIGIPESMIPFIFDRKGVARRTGLNGETSTGLGLSINKLLVEMMGGKIWLESEVDRGTTFYFTIKGE